MAQKRRRWIIVFIVLITTGTLFIFLDNMYISGFKSKIMAFPGNRPYSSRWYNDIQEDKTRCQMNSCFDYSRCTPSSGFQVYVYGMEQIPHPLQQDKHLYSHVVHVISQSPYVTKTPEKACIFLAVLEATPSDIEDRIHSLRFWNGDGSNHILLNIVDTLDDVDIFTGVDTGKAMVAQTSFIKTLFRDKFDFIIPPDFGQRNVPTWTDLPPLLPIRRRYFLSFYGAFRSTPKKYNTVTPVRHLVKNSTGSSSKHGNKIPNIRNVTQTNTLLETNVGKGNKSYLASIPASDIPIVETLMKIQENTNESIYINVTCDILSYNVLVGEWCLCGDKLARSDILNNSKFSVIISPVSISGISTIVFQTRFFESLKCGAVPVILGENVVLPYNELLDWSKAVVFLPKARAAYIHTYLSALGDDDILAMKMVGRMFWERYFGSTSSIIETTLAVLRGRLLIPPITVKDEASGNMHVANIPRIEQKGNSSTIVTEKVQNTVRNHQFPLIYQHNFSVDTLRGMFNTPGDPFHLYPFTPFQHFMSPDIPLKGKDTTTFHGKDKVTVKIVNGSSPGEPGTEEFTVVMLTYKTKRLALLKDKIVRLKDCPHLNKVVVVWNNLDVPPENITLPEIGVPLIVLNMTKNSLNNRFLPFDVIETEAVLAVDDDISVTHEELVFGFRVWRENRDRIVGYPGRVHRLNKQKNTWLYRNSGCELSMILTGQAFFHKYYAYLYSYVMPQAIRDHVDKAMNCEDIALNFLVAHISRKPHVKVSTKAYFYGASGLSNQRNHYKERDQCMNFFAKVYGYMPLLFTPYRADYIGNNVKANSPRSKCTF